MAKIKVITAREIVNSKAVPTVETTVVLTDGSIATASVPTGTSIGSYEATDLRDGDPARYQGMGALKAVRNIEQTITPALLDQEASNFGEIDKKLIELDGTQNKSVLGANAILSVSIAVAKAAARSARIPLYLYLKQFVKQDAPVKIPIPMFNILNGGEHAGMNVDFQEFMIIPASSKTFTESLEMSVVIYRALKSVLAENNLSTLLGDEGGFGPTLSTNMDAFALIKRAVTKANYKFDYDVFFGLDAAANTLYKDHHYTIRDKAMSFTPKDLIAFYEELNKQYPLLYLEDPLYEDEWDGYAELVTRLGQKTMIVADDLTTTNPYRVQMAISKKAASAIIIKPNQVGTVLESLAVVEVVREAGLKIIVSHRSGETNDDFIADFAVAVGADYVKFGAPARGERIAKYNKLLLIDQQLRESQK